MKITMTTISFKILSYYILYTIIAVIELEDSKFYEDKLKNFNKEDMSIVQDDFYITKILDYMEDRHNEYSYSKNILYKDTIDTCKDKNVFGQEFNWYKLPEKTYGYTKHRIPGYDYNEFGYMPSTSFQKCDEKSIWTHCLCQFTCLEPDIVDCYTPCSSGCECKEKYVFDEKTQKCLLPEYCFSEENLKYNIKITVFPHVHKIITHCIPKST